MNLSPLVSVIIPVYRVERYLDECVESVLRQSYENLEIILVDDGSPDRCGQMCDGYAERDARVRVIHKENGGLPAARNDALEICAGEYVVFLDSDDMLSRHAIQSMVEACDGDTHSIVAVGFCRFGASDRPALTQRPCAAKRVDARELLLRRGGRYCWGILYSARLIEELHLRFDPTLRNLEDNVWNGVYLLLTERIYYLDYPGYWYRRTPNSITSRCGDNIWQARSLLRAYESLVGEFCRLGLTGAQRRGGRRY